MALSSLALVAITPVAMSAMPAAVDFQHLRRPNFGLSAACDYTTPFAPRADCQRGDTPTVLVWGDSYAMHLMPGLVSELQPWGTVQATRSQCGPFLGIAPRRRVKPEHGSYIDEAWARDCIGFNQSVLDHLLRTPSIHTVVMSSPLTAYVSNDLFDMVVSRGTGFTTSPVDAGVTLAALQRTVAEVRGMGKRVVFVAPPPASDFNVGGCLERELSGAVVIGGQPGCRIDRATYLARRGPVLEFLDQAVTRADLPLIRFDPWLCDERSCATSIDGTMLYRDGGHLSYAGSELLATRMQLGKLVRDLAR